MELRYLYIGATDTEVDLTASPEGNATVLVNAGGVAIAILQVDRPTAMEDSFANPANDHAVRSRP